MKRFIALCILSIAFFHLISVYAAADNSIEIKLTELEWKWDPLETASFEGVIQFDDNTPDTVLIKLSFTAAPEASETGEVVFQTVNDKKLTLRKQKSIYTLNRDGADSFRFVGNWKTPENVYFTRVEITCCIYNNDETVLLAENKLVETRKTSDVLAIEDGRFRIRYNFLEWTQYALAAAGAVWVLAAFRMYRNIKRKK